MTDLLICGGGIAILLAGGELLVKGAASLARSFGVSSLVVGLTVIAFGTSAPELVVSVRAALAGSSTFAFGNIFGSNMANIGLIVGGCALIRPLLIDNVLVQRELPMMLLAVAAAAAMGFDSELNGMKTLYSRSDGIVFLLFFVVFIYYTLGDLLAQRNGVASAAASESAKSFDAEEEILGRARSAILVLLGLAGLFLGARFTVAGGLAIARALGVPEVILGLTLVSLGTSLPELVASVAAVRRGDIDLAVGGVVGSNIFNILLVCGVTAIVEPIEIPDVGGLDIGMTIVLSLILLLTARTHSRHIMRYEGLLLVVCYMSYMSWRTLASH